MYKTNSLFCITNLIIIILLSDKDVINTNLLLITIPGVIQVAQFEYILYKTSSITNMQIVTAEVM